MKTFTVQVKPTNPGDLTVRVWHVQNPPPDTPIDETFTVNNNSPLNKTWQLDSGLYCVTISWKNGYHNIAGSSDGNNIFVNNDPQYYQILGSPADGNGISVNFSYQL